MLHISEQNLAMEAHGQIISLLPYYAFVAYERENPGGVSI